MKHHGTPPATDEVTVYRDPHDGVFREHNEFIAPTTAEYAIDPSDVGTVHHNQPIRVVPVVLNSRQQSGDSRSLVPVPTAGAHANTDSSHNTNAATAERRRFNILAAAMGGLAVRATNVYPIRRIREAAQDLGNGASMLMRGIRSWVNQRRQGGNKQAGHNADNANPDNNTPDQQNKPPKTSKELYKELVDEQQAVRIELAKTLARYRKKSGGQFPKEAINDPNVVALAKRAVQLGVTNEEAMGVLRNAPDVSAEEIEELRFGASRQRLRDTVTERRRADMARFEQEAQDHGMTLEEYIEYLNQLRRNGRRGNGGRRSSSQQP